MGAEFSDCRTWRYSLTRQVQPGYRTVAFVGLNPSTADEVTDDPTIRRCVGFARRWDFASLVMLNLYAFRSTDPRGLRSAVDAIGPENDSVIERECSRASLVVCAWGVHAEPERARSVLRLIAEPRCLGVTKNGAPRHPLYLRGDTLPTPYVLP